MQVARQSARHTGWVSTLTHHSSIPTHKPVLGTYCIASTGLAARRWIITNNYLFCSTCKHSVLCKYTERTSNSYWGRKSRKASERRWQQWARKRRGGDPQKTGGRGGHSRQREQHIQTLGRQESAAQGTHTATSPGSCLTSLQPVHCSVKLEAIDVSMLMISHVNTHVMLLESNASKLVPCRGSICWQWTSVV